MKKLRLREVICQVQTAEKQYWTQNWLNHNAILSYRYKNNVKF